jgi:uncharacterized protein
MIVENQDEVISFLDQPENYRNYLPDLSDITVTRIDTHGAVVFLVGPYAFKMKRAVYFEYMDFSTLARREICCLAELTHNRRTSADIYKKVIAVVRSPSGQLVLGGEGDVVEWLVEMNRFDENKVFDRLALRGELGTDLVSETADMICEFFDQIEKKFEAGIADTIPEIVEETARQLVEGVPEVFNQTEVDALIRAQREACAGLGSIFDQRREEGFVRLCHGDLHLRNICLFDGKPMLFDAIEFNDRLAISDILYDLAFLLMDLLHRGLFAHANLVMNRYLERTGDDDGLALLKLYLSVRAGIRAFTAIPAAANQSDAVVAERVRKGAREYLALSTSFLQQTKPVLVGVGGFSGSGKSTLALQLASRLSGPIGAVVLRSDVIRKAMFSLMPTETLGPDGYSSAVTKKVYDKLMSRASGILQSGTSVIVDAVQARAEERRSLEEIARNLQLPFHGLWLEAPVETMSLRIEKRKNDASDADVDVLRQQLKYDTGEMTWSVLDGGLAREETLETACSMISEQNNV